MAGAKALWWGGTEHLGELKVANSGWSSGIRGEGCPDTMVGLGSTQIVKSQGICAKEVRSPQLLEVCDIMRLLLQTTTTTDPSGWYVKIEFQAETSTGSRDQKQRLGLG